MHHFGQGRTQEFIWVGGGGYYTRVYPWRKSSQTDPIEGGGWGDVPPDPDVENFLKFGLESAFLICIRKLTEIPKGMRCFSFNLSSKSAIFLTNGVSEEQI